MLQTIHIDQLVIPEDRQRREFEPTALMELTESIGDLGLLHPIVCRVREGKVVLVAGERRVRAIRDLFGLGMKLRCDGVAVEENFLPFVTLGDLTPLEAMGAELEENIRRKNLTWQEEAAAIKKLMEFRTAQAQAAGVPSPSVATLAEEVEGRSDGDFQAGVRRQLVVARHLADPEVAAAKNVKDAYKILKKKETVKENERLAAEVGKDFSSRAHTLLNGDFRDGSVVPLMVNSIDVILTDPPYGMNADEFGDAGGKLVAATHDYKDDYESWLPLMRSFVRVATGAAKPEAHAYVFCDIDRFHELRQMFLDLGWEVHRTPLIWTKPQSHRVPWPDYGPRRHWEAILYAVKGKKKTTAIYPDVIECRLDDNLGHPAQKPVELYANLLRRSIRPGNSVLDPFCGTGPIFAAAHELKCKATGIELSPSYYALAMKRLQKLDEQAELGL